MIYKILGSAVEVESMMRPVGCECDCKDKSSDYSRGYKAGILE